jgi:hypothetical protein
MEGLQIQAIGGFDEARQAETHRSSWPSYGHATTRTPPDCAMDGEEVVAFEERFFHYVDVDFEDLHSNEVEKAVH